MTISSLEVFGVLGAFASILSLWIAAPSWKSRFVHIAYSLFIVGLGVWFMSYQQGIERTLSELEQIKRTERQAEFLTGNVDLSTAGNMQGYMQAVLAFLEKNQKLYPETYERAKLLCVNSGCADSGYGEGKNSMRHFYSMQEASSAMKILIKGVSQLGAE